MIANTKDRDLAMQAAEAALRDAEQDVATTSAPATAFTDACTGGLCTPPSQRAGSGRSRRCRSTTRCSASTGPSPPTCAATASTPARPAIPERGGAAGLRDREVQLPRHAGGRERRPRRGAGGAPGVGYRITARAVGARPETVVVLQSIYTCAEAPAIATRRTSRSLMNGQLHLRSFPSAHAGAVARCGRLCAIALAGLARRRRSRSRATPLTPSWRRRSSRT